MTKETMVEKLTELLIQNGGYLTFMDSSFVWTWNLGSDDEYESRLIELTLKEGVVSVYMEDDYPIPFCDLFDYDRECAEFVYDAAMSK